MSKVVGQDRPAGPGLLALIAFEPAAAQAVAAFEVTDAPFGTGAVALQPALGASGAGLLAPGDEHPLGRELFERLGRRGQREATVQRDLAWCEPKLLELADGRGSSVFSPGLPGSEAAGTIKPRASRLVFGVTSTSCAT